MIQATAGQLMKQFADNLKKQLAAAPPATAARATAVPSAAPTPQGPTPQPATPQPPPAAAPISGFSLMARVIWDAIMRLFGRRPS
jgi:hypothetical protein